MIVQVEPKTLAGTVSAIASKSDAHRKLICAALADKPTELRLSTSSDDIEATADCLRALGADICRREKTVYVTPISEPPEHPSLDCGESGSTLRFMLPVAAAISDKVSFKGSGRLPVRPILALTDAMKEGGVRFSADKLPFTTVGRLKSGEYSLPGNISSQYITGLMLALPMLCGDSMIKLTTKLQSTAYVDITLAVLKSFRVEIEIIDSGYLVHCGGFKSPGSIGVEGDWSNAAFFLAAGAIGNPVAVSGLDTESTQGDKGIINIISKFGGIVDISGDCVMVRSSELRGTEIDMSEIPDLAPISAVLGCCAEGETRLVNAARLRLKESDRLTAVATMIRNLGGNVQELSDGLVIQGGKLRGGKVDSFHDHRIVMAASVAATVCEKPVIISDAGAVNKSYPSFFADFRAMGGECHAI